MWTPPITTPLLAEVLKDQGWTVSLVDARLVDGACEGDEQLVAASVDAICRTAPAVVGFSFLSPSAKLAEQIAVSLRERLPEVPLLAGGVHCTVAPHRYTRPYAAIVRGEGEEVIGDLCETLLRDPSPSNQVIVRSSAPDLNQSQPVLSPAWPPYDRVTAEANPKSAYLEIGRGCAFRCSFCEIAVKENFPAFRRTRHRDTVLEEATRLHREFGVDFFIVTDSIATTAPGFRETFSSLAGVLEGCSIMLNSATPVLDEATARTIGSWQGPVSVWLGLESASPRVGKRELGSKWQPSSVEKALHLCEVEQIDVGLNCIFGFADEDDADRQATLELLDRAAIAYPNPNILSPLPGTPLYQTYLERALLRDPDDLSVWPVNRILEQGMQGPVLDVDYPSVIEAYSTALETRGPSRRSPSDAGWNSWSRN